MRAQHDKYAWSGLDEDSPLLQTTTNSMGEYSSTSSSSSNAATATTTTRGAGSGQHTNNNNNNRHLIARIAVISENFYGVRFANSDNTNCLTASDRSLVHAKFYTRSSGSNSGGSSRQDVFKIHLFNVNSGEKLIFFYKNKY